MYIDTPPHHKSLKNSKLTQCPNVIGREPKDSFNLILIKFLLAFDAILQVSIPFARKDALCCSSTFFIL